jgi:hypothetical protein
MTDHDEALRKICGTTLDATKRWMAQSVRQQRKDDEVEELMSDLYYAARAGWAAAEYNLEKASLIEMIQGHRAGQFLNDNWWCDCRWTLTERGRRTSMARLARVMVRDPPLEIAERDAEDEANDVATNCGGEGVDSPTLTVHRHILAKLHERVERIRRKAKV